MNEKIASDLKVVMALLEMPVGDIDFTNHAYETAVVNLNKFRAKLRKQRRILANKYHPDKETGNQEKMKEINQVIDLLLKIEIKRPQPVNIFTNGVWEECSQGLWSYRRGAGTSTYTTSL